MIIKSDINYLILNRKCKVIINNWIFNLNFIMINLIIILYGKESD